MAEGLPVKDSTKSKTNVGLNIRFKIYKVEVKYDGNNTNL